MKNIKILLFILAIFLFWGVTNVNAETGTGSVTVNVILPTPAVPVLINSTSNNVTSTSATIYATLTSWGIETNGSTGVLNEAGFKWETNSPPNANGDNDANPQLNVPFSKTLTGLTPNTKYYYRGFTSNGFGEGTAPIIGSFKTLPPPSLPAVTSPTCTNFTSTSVTAGANVTSLGYPTSITRGTCVGGYSPGNYAAEGGTTTGVLSSVPIRKAKNTIFVRNPL